MDAFTSFANKMTTTFLLLLVGAVSAGAVIHVQTRANIVEKTDHIARVESQLNEKRDDLVKVLGRSASIETKIQECLVDPEALGCQLTTNWESDLQEAVAESSELTDSIASSETRLIELRTDLIALEALAPTIIPTWGSISVALFAIWGAFRLTYLSRKEKS